MIGRPFDNLRRIQKNLRSEPIYGVAGEALRHALDHSPAGFPLADNIATSHGVLSLRS